MRTWFEGERGRRRAAVILLLALSLLFMARTLFLEAGQVVGEDHDMRGAYYLWHDAVHRAVHEGSLPWWDPFQFSGYPFLVNPQVGAFYPPAWLTVLLPTQIGISWYLALHLWLAGVGMLLLVRIFGGNWLGALLAGLTFAFSAFMSARIWAGHAGPLVSNAWLPWLALSLVWSVRRGEVWAAVLAGGPLALAVLAGHTTSLLYMGLGWGAVAFYLLLVEQERRVLRQAAIMGVMGLALSAVQLLPLAQFGLLSSRAALPSLDFATNYSMPPAHLVTLIVPEYFGEPVRAGYWSVPNFVELTAYAGILPLLGIALALRRPTRLAWFYLALMALGLLLAMGHYGFLYRVLYDLLPPFRLARAPGRAAILYIFAASALLGEALSAWQRMPIERVTRQLGGYWRWTVALAAMAAVAALAATGAVFAAQHPSETSGRLWHQLGGWLLALAWTVIGGGLIWGYLTAGEFRPTRRRAVAAGLALLVISDLWTFGHKMVRTSPTGPEPMWRDAKALIGNVGERVLPWGVPVFWQNGAGQVGLRSVFGYNSLAIGDYETFVASVPDPRATSYDILSAAYVVASVPLANFTDGDRPLTLVANTESAWVYRRARPMPGARLVYETEVIGEVAATIQRVHAAGFEPAHTAILAEPAGCQIGPEPAQSGSAQITGQRPGYWRIETTSASPALLVLSETAYPGWRVTVDGRPADWLTAYTVVRAACVPAGRHVVEWRYVPTIFYWGGAVSLAGLILVLWAAVKGLRAAGVVGGMG